MKRILAEFKEIIGRQEFDSVLTILRGIGPHARTHRISVVIASILRFALTRLPAHCDDGTLSQALIMLDEEPHLGHGESKEYMQVYELIDCLCSEAGILNRRESARGETYSLAENAILEYACWYNMPWEDS